MGEHDLDSADTVEPRKVAYMVSQYPKLSEIFVIREVLQLRQFGFDIITISINAPDRGTEGLTADEAREASTTVFLKPKGVTGALQAHLRQATSRPGGYLNGLSLATRLAGADLRALFFNLMYWTEGLMAASYLDDAGHHHIHAHLGSQAATVGMFTKAVTGCDFSITVHGPDEFYDAYRQNLGAKVAHADFVVCISHFARSQLMKLSSYEHWHKFEVSRLGVDPSVFAPREPRSLESGADFNVLCVGRLTPAKGQHLLVEALKIMRDEGRNARLTIVGGGVDHDSLVALAEKSGLTPYVNFTGPVNQDRIRELYGEADCFCIPSFAEGIPVVLMEAMAMQIPVVTTRITGIPELIDDGETGILVAPSDVPGLAAALGRVMDDRQKAHEMAERGRAKVVADYDLSRNVKRLARIFSKRVRRAASR